MHPLELWKYATEETKSVASTEIFRISVLVSDNDCNKQPKYEYCGEGTKWLQDHCKTTPITTVCSH